MSSSIQLHHTPPVDYLLRIGDTCLVHAQRLTEWCGHAPILEEDIAMANTALDLIGQARALLTRAGERAAIVHDEDQLAFLRDERDYRNLTITELPRGDFAFSVIRNAIVATFLKQLWMRLVSSSDAELAAIAAKAVKESRYHQQHAAGWVVRLGDGSAESRRRCEQALNELWRFTTEMFESDAVDRAAVATGLGPDWAELREPWLAEMRSLLDEATLAAPADSGFRSTGRRGVHSEHMGFLLANLQYLQRAYPGGVW